MRPATEIFYTLASVLKKELGAEYEVLVAPRRGSIAGVPIARRPDFVVHDRSRGHTTIVEVNGSNLREELSVAAAFQVLNIREDNKALHPRMVLVSTSRLDQMIRHVLSTEGVEMIVTDKPAEAVSRVTSLLRDAG